MSFITQATRRQPNQRLQWKLEVTKSLYRRGYSRQNILELFRLVNWIMTLPEELESSFNTEIAAFEEAEKMPYITPLERFAQKAGVLTRGREDILDILETRFGPVPSSVSDRINAIDDATELKTLLIQAVTIASLEDFETAIAPKD
ncbi:MAG: hypothetical protein JJU32_18815 [Phormidium sp. BM_Day4_Bin.17]|nr:hypothetical protein [Phormidium sp. BM_Day4_Bin.17]